MWGTSAMKQDMPIAPSKSISDGRVCTWQLCVVGMFIPARVAWLLLKLLEMIHGSDRCLVQLDVSLIIPKVWTALSFTIAQIISVLTAEPSVTVL